MKIYDLNKLSSRRLNDLLKRPSVYSAEYFDSVSLIINKVKSGGLKEAIKFAKKYDDFSAKNIFVQKEEFSEAEKLIGKNERKALKTAFENIYKFHTAQLPKDIKINTMRGITCSRKYKPISNVGLYIPGGNAVLPSTVLMLGIPAKIAGCRRVVISTPVKGNKINPYVLYAAKLCGINEVVKIGGVQGIALMAYGDKKIQKVDKIFGPGNKYVTLAKKIVSQDFDSVAIDMAAGPSEVLVIADDYANPSYVASDLLSQAEHGGDSQVILTCTSKSFAENVRKEIALQSEILVRKEIVMESLKNSRIFIAKNIEQAIELSNVYAPEHLILNVQNSEKYVDKINNAGSVFLGELSPESAGDYASGTNHSLPTYGLAKTTGGVTVEMFMKSITYQKLSRQGLKNISDVVITLANIEKLQAHANAVKVRLK
jgi:histidinol dehydrogenase